MPKNIIYLKIFCFIFFLIGQYVFHVGSFQQICLIHHSIQTCQNHFIQTIFTFTMTIKSRTLLKRFEQNSLICLKTGSIRVLFTYDRKYFTTYVFFLFLFFIFQTRCHIPLSLFSYLLSLNSCYEYFYVEASLVAIIFTFFLNICLNKKMNYNQSLLIYK